MKSTKTLKKDIREYRHISTLKNWDHNPRVITKEGIERLKRQIKKLGQYKPLLITDDGIVLGGNMRLKAYEELKIDDVWVSVVEAETEEKRIEYALSDNDRAGRYDNDELINIVGSFPEIEWADYSVDLDEPLVVEDIMKSLEFDPKKEWKDMPKFKQDGVEVYKMIIVRFLKQEDYEKFCKAIGQELTEKTKSIWFPPHDFDSLGRDVGFKKENES